MADGGYQKELDAYNKRIGGEVSDYNKRIQGQTDSRNARLAGQQATWARWTGQDHPVGGTSTAGSGGGAASEPSPSGESVSGGGAIPASLNAGSSIAYFNTRGRPSPFCAADMNALVDVANGFLKMRVLVNSGYADANGNGIVGHAPFSFSPGGCSIDLTGIGAGNGGSSGASLFVARLTADDAGGNTLSCVVYGTSTAITVLKPVELQGTFSAPQIVWPKYSSGSIILVASSATGWAGEGLGANIDLNIGARQVLYQQQICNSGVSNYILLNAPPQVGAFV